MIYNYFISENVLSRPVNVLLKNNDCGTDIPTNINSYVHLGDLSELTQFQTYTNNNLNPNAKEFVPKRKNGMAYTNGNLSVNVEKSIPRKGVRVFLNPLAKVFFPNSLSKTNLTISDTLSVVSANRSSLTPNCCTSTFLNNISTPKISDNSNIDNMFTPPHLIPLYDYESTLNLPDIDDNVYPSPHILSTPAISMSSNYNINDTLVDTSSLNASMTTPYLDESDNDDSAQMKDLSILKNIRISNINRLVIGQLNINSIRNKFQALKAIMSGNLDILVITESKIDDSFPIVQFIMEGYSPPFRLDRNANGGGVLIYVRDDIACRELKKHPPKSNIEGIFLELNLKRSKWLVFGGYNPSKDNIADFVKELVTILTITCLSMTIIYC